MFSKFFNKKTHLIAVCALATVALFGYWLKCQLGVNMFESISLSDHIPFKYFQMNNVILSPRPGLLINDSFNSNNIIDSWSLWMRQGGKVSQGHDFNGLNNSRCLLITNRSERNWSYSYNKFIEVKKGDTFSSLVLRDL